MKWYAVQLWFINLLFGWWVPYVRTEIAKLRRMDACLEDQKHILHLVDRGYFPDLVQLEYVMLLNARKMKEAEK